MSLDDAKAVLTAFLTGGDDSDDEDGVHVRLVSFDKIKADAFDLNIKRYVRSDRVEGDDLGTVLAAYQAARAAPIRAGRSWSSVYGPLESLTLAS